MLRRKDVNDHRTEIQEDPAAFGVAFDACDPPPGGLDRLDDSVGDRSGLDLRTPGDQREVIGEDRFRTDLERLELLALFLLRGRADDINEC